MNGSENCYAGAIFFALISLGAALKIDDAVTGGVLSVVGAILAAISLRQALNRSAQAAEEDHQRLEIQFQQLRTKIIETSSASIDAMNSLNDVTQLLRENLQSLREHSSNMENFTSLVKTAESINVAIAGLEENSFALNTMLEKIFIAIQAQGRIADLNAGLKNFAALEETLAELRLEVAKLSDKLKTINERQAPLTAEDFDNLKKIMAKINLK